ncbi:MAG: hypothetical protein F9B45_12550 [Phycisphaera sp. RhM]|nr:hypothetical protein [Phycisphaera sp. RhM]
MRDIRRQQQNVNARIDTLTAREREVMDRLSEGQSTKVIASRLGISTKTVDNHRAKVLEKMIVDNVAQLANLCALIS